MSKEEPVRSIENTPKEEIDAVLCELALASGYVSDARLNEALHKYAESIGEKFFENVDEDDLTIIEEKNKEGIEYMVKLAGPIKEEFLQGFGLRVAINKKQKILVFKPREEEAMANTLQAEIEFSDEEIEEDNGIIAKQKKEGFGFIGRSTRGSVNVSDADIRIVGRRGYSLVFEYDKELHDRYR